MDGTGDHHLKRILLGSEGQKLYVFHRMRIIDPKQCSNIIGQGSHTKGVMCTGETGKGKETQNLNVFDVLTVEELI
jgi:hypothetical protein